MGNIEDAKYWVDNYGDLRWWDSDIPVEDKLGMLFTDDEDSILFSHGNYNRVEKKWQEYNDKVMKYNDGVLPAAKIIGVPVRLIKENNAILEDINRCISNSSYITSFIKKYELA